jgi:hypothetical protein
LWRRDGLFVYTALSHTWAARRAHDSVEALVPAVSPPARCRSGHGSERLPARRNLQHLRPSSVTAIGNALEDDGKTTDPANHQYDSHDFFDRSTRSRGR